MRDLSHLIDRCKKAVSTGFLASTLYFAGCFAERDFSEYLRHKETTNNGQFIQYEKPLEIKEVSPEWLMCYEDILKYPRGGFFSKISRNKDYSLPQISPDIAKK